MTKSKSKVLVTGGAGYIGSHAVDALIQSGLQVIVLDNFSTGFHELVHPKAQLIQGDIRETSLISRIFNDEKIESILHFAAFTGVAESLAHPDRYYRNNFEGTLSLLRASVKSPLKYFVFSSTAAVYKDPGQQLVTELSETEPVTPYGKTKLMSEKIIQESAGPLNLKYTILRYFNVAGASESGLWGQRSKDANVIVKRAAMVASGQIPSLSIFGTDYATLDGTAVRDFIHVEDLADLHVEALRYLQQGGSSEILNCGYGHGYSVRQVMETMKKVSGHDFPVKMEGRRPGDLPQVVAANDKIKNLLKWKPKRDNLELICKTAYEWELKTTGK
jgi:UDP-glucose 4-epimerase